MKPSGIVIALISHLPEPPTDLTRDAFEALRAEEYRVASGYAVAVDCGSVEQAYVEAVRAIAAFGEFPGESFRLRLATVEAKLTVAIALSTADNDAMLLLIEGLQRTLGDIEAAEPRWQEEKVRFETAMRGLVEAAQRHLEESERGGEV